MSFDLSEYATVAERTHGTVQTYWRGCRCVSCTEANRLYALALRRSHGVGAPLVIPPEERFWAKVEKSDDARGCWFWKASLSQDGYGLFRLDSSTTCSAHRLSYRWENGEIPEGLVLDHLCGNRRCVRPDHLEPVTHAENLRRSRLTHCKRGHEFTPENTLWMRTCRECARTARRRRNAA